MYKIAGWMLLVFMTLDWTGSALHLKSICIALQNINYWAKKASLKDVNE